MLLGFEPSFARPKLTENVLLSENDRFVCLIVLADKDEVGVGDLRVLSMLEVHEVLQDLEDEGERPTEEQYGVPQWTRVPRSTDLSALRPLQKQVNFRPCLEQAIGARSTYLAGYDGLDCGYKLGAQWVS